MGYMGMPKLRSLGTLDGEVFSVQMIKLVGTFLTMEGGELEGLHHD